MPRRAARLARNYVGDEKVLRSLRGSDFDEHAQHDSNELRAAARHNYSEAQMADDASHTHLHVSHRHRSPSPALRPRAPPRAAGGGGVWRPHILWLPWIYLFAVGLAAYIGASTVYARAGGYVAAAAAACGRAFPALPRPCMLLFTRAFHCCALIQFCVLVWAMYCTDT